MSQANQPIPPPTTSNSAAPQKPKNEALVKLQAFGKFLDQQRVTDQLALVLPNKLQVDRQKKLLLSSLRRTPKVLFTTHESLVGAVLQTFELGLSPIAALGHAYFVPFESKGRLICQLIIGYRGLIELARRSGVVSSIRAEVVRRGDYFHYSLGLSPDLQHVPADVLEYATEEQRLAVRQALGGKPADGRLVAAYAVVILKDGTKEFRVVTQEFINRIKKASRGSNHPDSPWKNWEDQMWAKTAIRQVLKFVPLSPEDQLIKGLEVDEAAFSGIKTLETVGTDVPESNGSSEMSSVDEALTIESEGNVVASGMDAFVQHQQAPATADDVPAEIAGDAPGDEPSTTTAPVEQPAPQPPKAQRRRRGPQPS